MNNIGDNIQIITIDYLYGLLGISEDQIEYVDKDCLAKYESDNGEKAILPVSMPLVDYVDGGISGRFSDDIIPVFLGLTMVKDELDECEIKYLKKFEPIGCRDERTYDTLRKYEINAYLNGCFTLTLPYSNSKEKKEKIFFVDTPDSLDDFVPNEIKDSIVKTTHIFYDETIDPKEKMKEQYDMYKKEAKLVVTSLLHCSVPCIAAGIPVIIAKSAISYRFAWLDKIIKIYKPEEFGAINWYPEAPDISNFKKRYTEMILNRLRGINNKQEMDFVHNYFMKRQRNAYVVDAFESLKKFIDENWKDESGNYLYSVWGMTQTAEYLVSYINKKYRNSKLVYLFDKYKKLNYKGIRTVFPDPDSLNDFPESYLFVTTYSANDEARETFPVLDHDQKIAYMDIIV